MVASKKSPNPEQMHELETLLHRDPSSARFSELADIYTRMARFQEAVQLCHRGLGCHQRDARGYLSLGRALFGMGRLAVASEALERAIKFAPDESEAYRLLGEVLVRRGLVDEAIKVLESAVERGNEDPHIERLLQRADVVLDAEQTRVTGAPKGMGNQAIAGTIGGTRPTDLTVLEAEARGLVESSEDILAGERSTRHDVEQPTLEVFPELMGEGVEKPRSQEWRAVGAQWEQHLNSQTDGRLLTDPEVPVGQQVDLEPPPLSDPVAEGMPPLPEETRELSLPPRGPDERALAHGMGMGAGDAGVAEPTPVLEVAETFEVPKADASFEPAPMESWAKQDFHELRASERKERPSDPTVAERQFEESLLHDLAQGETSRSAGAAAERRADDFGATSEASQLRNGRGGARRLLLVFLIFALIGAGGFLAWKGYQGYKARLEGARILEQGIARGTSEALEEAAKALREVAGATPRDRQVGLRLLKALSVLWHGGEAGKASSAASGGGWLDAAASAAEMLSVAVAEGAADDIQVALGAEPAADQPLYWLHPLLMAQILEREGRYGQVMERLQVALSRAPQAMPALLMRARSWLILGWYEQAEDDFRGVIAKHPTHAWARVGLAAALARRGRKPTEPLGNLSKSRGSPQLELAAMTELLRAELSDTPGALLSEATAEKLPPTVLVLTYATRALGAACLFGQARRMIEMLRIQHPRVRALVSQLEGELALARGLDHQAAGLMGTKVVSVAQLRLRAWAELLTGRPERVASLLDGDRSDVGRPLHLVSGALQLLKGEGGARGGRKPAMGALESLVDYSFQARIGLVLVLAKMKLRDDALKVLKKGGFRLAAQEARARTLEATFLGEQDGELALPSLRAATQRCRGYAPALALEGRLRLEVGDTEHARRLLAEAQKGGLATSSLLQALARAELALGRPEPAVKLLTEKTINGEAAALLHAELALARKRPKRARALLSALQPSVRRLLLRARVAMASGRRSLGLRILREGRSRHPQSLLLMGMLGQGLVSTRGRVTQKQGRVLLARCVELASARGLGRTVGARAALALAQIALREEDEDAVVLRALARAEKLDPTLAAVPRVRAEFYLDVGRKAAARKALERATQLAPRDARGRLLLGRVCAALRDWACARREFSAAVELAPRLASGRRAARELARLR